MQPHLDSRSHDLMSYIIFWPFLRLGQSLFREACSVQSSHVSSIIEATTQSATLLADILREEKSHWSRTRPPCYACRQNRTMCSASESPPANRYTNQLRWPSDLGPIRWRLSLCLMSLGAMPQCLTDVGQTRLRSDEPAKRLQRA